jgi:hypothetical protein
LHQQGFYYYHDTLSTWFCSPKQHRTAARIAKTRTIPGCSGLPARSTRLLVSASAKTGIAAPQHQHFETGPPVLERLCAFCAGDAVTNSRKQACIESAASIAATALTSRQAVAFLVRCKPLGLDSLTFLHKLRTRALASSPISDLYSRMRLPTVCVLRAWLLVLCSAACLPGRHLPLFNSACSTWRLPGS